ncbi:alpha/beta hydrolase [Burkholderia sp. FERM BP-3421]|jgi:acetyl esterase/lipase|uniref:alpha/beta hydrolase n=1 Tax=Burkholderia sp. FERM BP-3421 TaxID=1494466 RepID=UPI003FCD8686
MMLTGVLLFGSVLAFGVVAGWRPAAVLNVVAGRSSFVGRYDLAYGDGPRHALDVYAPARRPGGAPVPLVVFFYGGSWQSGRRSDYKFVGEALASRGCVAVIPDYRLYPDAVFPAFVEDAAAAVRWARDHAVELGADPSRLFLMGHSAGAQIAAMLATDARFLAEHEISKRDIAGVIGLAGPYDFLPLRDETLMRIFPEPARAASQPINFVDGGEPPMLLASGANDTTVRPANTDRFAARLQEAGSVVRVKHYAGVGHAVLVGAFGLPVRPFVPLLDDVTAFIASAEPRR